MVIRGLAAEPMAIERSFDGSSVLIPKIEEDSEVGDAMTSVLPDTVASLLCATQEPLVNCGVLLRNLIAEVISL